MYETRGNAKFYYSYDANGTLYSVNYTLADNAEMQTYYYTHNAQGDIIGIYDSTGTLVAKYTYGDWGNIVSITDANGTTITDPNHIATLNPFRYRGYYYDSETGFYYLMTRYYDPVTHRFINADGTMQSGINILDINMFTYCRNNPITHLDPIGEACFIHGDHYNDPGCKFCRPDFNVIKMWEIGKELAKNYSHIYLPIKLKNTNDKFKPRTDKRKSSENRQPSGFRERNVGHKNGEEHSRVAKGNGIKRIIITQPEPICFDKVGAGVTLVGIGIASLYLIANNITGVGTLDDTALIPLSGLAWECTKILA